MAAATRAPEVDLYRDTPIRYLGYANELGESFRPLYPKLVAPSYAISFGYVALDTVDKVLLFRTLYYDYRCLYLVSTPPS